MFPSSSFPPSKFQKGTLVLNRRIRFYANRAAIRERPIILGFVGKTVKTFT